MPSDDLGQVLRVHDPLQATEDRLRLHQGFEALLLHQPLEGKAAAWTHDSVEARAT